MAKTIKKNTENEKILVIVESPAKSKTIKKILGSNYEIEASFGHIRDFPPKVLGFDVENNFEPTFQVIPEKKDVVKKLNTLAKKSNKIYLASDPDREGEAIAWHVRQVLDVTDDKIYRIEFNEITAKAVKHAVDNPRIIDMERVKAQQTRQILDRLVGYKISPVLWEKLRNFRLSAGRVQSVALRLVCEREDEIEKFVPKEYWNIIANLQKDGIAFDAELTKYKNKKLEIPNQEKAEEILKVLNDKNTKFLVSGITYRDTSRKPSAPFITSTLQREASNKLGYGVSKTMQIAQKLYEGIDIGNDGPTGLITYMRTDSTRISDDAQAVAKEFIVENYGEKYYPSTPNNYVKKTKKNVQDAHEAIRPSYIDKTPDSLKAHLTPEQYKLYKLIWDRFMASQMAQAKVKTMSINIEASEYIFKVGSSKIEFEGFLKVYQSSEDEPSIKNQLPSMNENDELILNKLTPSQHFTQPLPRYTEASLVKALEEHGIGRPSTYAPIISKIQQKGYVEKKEKSLCPTILGRTVCAQLVEYFKDIMNYEFTAQMETKLDDIAESHAVWTEVLKEFYDPFMHTVVEAKQNMQTVKIVSGKNCPNCGLPMLVRTSRFGKQFLGCSGYPDCKTMLPLLSEGQEAASEQISDEKCEKCNSEMIIKFGPYGQYLQCKNEECKHRKKIVKTTGVKCPQEGCDGDLIERKSRFGKLFYGCSKYPDCNFVVWNEPVDERCPKCNSILVKNITKRYNRLKCSNKECDFTRNLEELEPDYE